MRPVGTSEIVDILLYLARPPEMSKRRDQDQVSPTECSRQTYRCLGIGYGVVVFIEMKVGVSGSGIINAENLIVGA